MNFQRYLSAKRTVDERALNPRVERRLADEIEERSGDGSGTRDPLHVLEVGAGIGATVERLLARPWLPDRVAYTALDLLSANVAAARQRLPERAAELGYAVRTDGDRLVASRGKRRIEIEFLTADAFEFLAETDDRWDLLIAHAFVDLVDSSAALRAFRGALAPEGVAYCPITFDGGTYFEPARDPEFEDHLVERFHRHIDESGDSRAGRHLLSVARKVGEGDAEGGVLAAGGSDWLVRPRDGDYPADEAYFLHYIVDAISGAVRDDPEVADRRLSEWVNRRRHQIDETELTYCAHQLDLLVR
ncbi:class I SAM-dependent methyltransferase [Halobacteriales archaeon SW_6_65_15]|nr:MAG: class I SAM-dependent methyltransferase [Halobacteriales archaeon SW_6_65_15]